jgi:putative FmdB family regulatory protein
MPLYEFQCDACGNRFERIQKFSDPNPETCPKCGKSPVRKLPSSPAIQFKGSGFYITDYPKKSSSEAGSKTGGSDGSGSSSSSNADKSSDSKSSDTKSADSKKSTDSPSTGTKSSDSKSTDSKS